MAKSANKTSKKTAKPAIAHQKRTAKAIASAIAKARKASGKRGGDDADIHVHVGDVVMMGFDEAVDAEEWGARETNNELGVAKGRRGRSAREADPQDEKNRKVHRTITLRKGALKLQAVEKSQPAKKKRAAKKAAKKKARRR
ncbi:MAG: hypothetical protein ACKO3G_15560 [Planctomycetaceae bacterium]